MGCIKTLSGKIFSAIRSGDNATLSTLLTNSPNLISTLFPYKGKYLAGPSFSTVTTSIYLYGSYLANQYPVRATGLAMLDTLNAALEGVIATAIKGTATPTSLRFTHDPITHQILRFSYVGPGAGGLQTGMISSVIGNLIYLQDLSISLCNLSGGIPAEIGNLTQLGTGNAPSGSNGLVISNAGLTGEIPSEIGMLSNLKILSINKTGLTGAIPKTLEKLTKLNFLILNFNQLSGSFPDWLPNLTSLSMLRLENNGLTGTIPTSLWNLESYENIADVEFSGNCLVGPALADPNPSAIGSSVIASAISKALSNRGSSCASVSDTNTGTSTQIAFGLSGSATVDWQDSYPLTLALVVNGTQTQTQTFSYPTSTSTTTNTSTSIPFGFSNLPAESTYLIQNLDSIEVNCASSPSGTLTASLSTLQISCSRTLVGKILSAVRTLDNSTLSTLLTADTTGAVASLLPLSGIYDAAPLFSPGNTTVYLYAAQLLNNNRSPSAGQKALLITLNTALNTILQSELQGTGTGMPISTLFQTDAYQNITSIWQPNVENNKLLGVLSDKIGNLLNLQTLQLQGINLVPGPIPSTIGNLTQLYSLGLVGVNLVSTIPSSIGNLTKLTYLHLGSNQLSGQIPSSVGNLIKLNHLGLTFNKLSGQIPSSIGNLVNLDQLELDSNQLIGEVIPAIWTFAKLKNLQLGRNFFSGSIPSAVGDLTLLSQFSIGNNCFSSLPSTTGITNNTILSALTSYKRSTSCP